MDTGIPLPGLDPLVFDVLDIKGQIIMGSKPGKKIGGSISLFGTVIKSMGAAVMKPCKPAAAEEEEEEEEDEAPEPEEETEYWGYCGIDASKFTVCNLSCSSTRGSISRRSANATTTTIPISATLLLGAGGGIV